jgi:hypothetical protein
MKIKIREDAREQYIVHRMVPGGGFINWEWADKLRAIQGMTLDVETTHLFGSQFNTVPIDGVSDVGMRIMAESVDEVIDDVRAGMMKCGWDYHVAPVGFYCPKCGRKEYLRRFDMSHHNVVARMVALED